MPRRLHLNAFLSVTGHHEASWRLPESDPLVTTDAAYFQRLAQVAERGLLDSLFLADAPQLHNVGQQPSGRLEPFLLLTAIAATTTEIGLIGTASTSYNSPYNLARKLGTLDHISAGRAGWNIVTTAGPQAARNFGLDDTPAHHQRYERAEEFLDVVTKLWDSWDDDAIIADKTGGVWADPNKIYPPRHTGRFFAVDGALNLSRSPQGYPLLVQAGSSETGRAFAARHAEAVFTAQQTLAEAQDFYRDLRALTQAVGRDPRSIKILPGLVPVIGDTESHARKVEQELAEAIVPRYALARLAQRLEVPIERLDLDRPLPDDLAPESSIQTEKARYTLIVDLARRESLTVRQLLGRLGGGRGHRTFTGTPEQIADTMQEWFENGAADGFNVMPALLPRGLDDFVTHVVPILQQRGLFRREYTPNETLRDRYGASRPANRNTLSNARIASPSTEPPEPNLADIAAGGASLDQLLAFIAERAADRDRLRENPFAVIDLLRRVRFGALRVPVEQGGGGLSIRELFEIVVRLGEADSNVAQILRNHFHFGEWVLRQPNRTIRDKWVAEIVAGKLFGLASSELGPDGPAKYSSRVSTTEQGLRLTGEKFYTTGTLYADWVFVSAVDDNDQVLTVVVPTDREGVTVYDDWDGMGQRLTGTGTTTFHEVVVETSEILPRPPGGSNNHPYHATFAGLFLTAIVAGIVRAGVSQAATIVRGRKRNFRIGSDPIPTQDPYVQTVVGKAAAAAAIVESAVLHASDALDAAVDAAVDGVPDPVAMHEAEYRSSAAKIIADSHGVDATTTLFDVAGASATREPINLDRHWRNARTLSTHNPSLYRARALGDLEINGTLLPDGVFR